jgi:2-(1,2-epoxy-1,2-dihydrophenyl)acetyl-CoA isomerase
MGTPGTSGAVARIELDRPQALNALTAELVERLLAELRAAGEDPAVRAVCISGQGRGFCAGTDLSQNFRPGAPPAEQNLRASRHPLLLAIRALEKPVVAAVNGVAAGIGISLALACDLVVARRGAVFNFAFTRVGLVPDGGASFFLQRAVGAPRAARLLMHGESVDGAEAERIGLVAASFPDEEFEAEIDALLERLAAGPTLAYALTKRALDGAAVNSLPAQMELEASLQARASRSADFAEGRAAFAEKRAPRFEGRRWRPARMARAPGRGPARS